MNRLPSELHRLYAAQAPGPDTAPEALRLIDGSGQVRAMVLSLARPADWPALAKVWQGVQVDLDLPAPAIAVSGTDAYQLWFSLAQPLPAAQALVFLESLRLRYLGDIKPQRVGLMPSRDGASLPQWLHASSQSSLLARLSSIPRADFELALQRLNPAQASAPDTPAPAVPDAVVSPMGQRKAAAGPWLDPKSFLLEVMNNDAVELRLRIEAAKALLPHVDTTGPVPGVPQP
ncbi:MAG: hypothetical protein EBY28_18140 [Betaproteobacteria bacterium]|nr:hypothetical protein [Betaproteobacteria bacterium]